MGKFHGHDHADHPEGLVERDVDPSGDRDLLADHALGSARVVVQNVANVAGLPASRPDRVPGVRHLEQRQFLDVGLDGRRKAAQCRGALGGSQGRP